MAYLSHLSLTNFRNMVELELELPEGVVVFFGPNAQGKTTLLEAVYLLAIARSFRAENEREVLNFQAAAEGGQGLVGGTVERVEEKLQVYVGYQCIQALGAKNSSLQTSNHRAPSVRKQIRVDRVRRTAAELVGVVNAVLFSAEDIELVLGPPADRRRFLDILISQADPLYLKGLLRYQKVVQQRNQLLRMLQDGRAEVDELAFWDGELVKEGAWITWRRQEVMKELAVTCGEHHDDLVDSEGDFQVAYLPSVGLGTSLQATEEQFRESLAAVAQRERATGNTAVGPHRDDFNLLIDGVDMGTFASRGQARTLALALRLAEASYLASARGEAPIVLLDDVLSEMDGARRGKVLGKATQYQQVLITTTDVDQVKGFFGAVASYFQVAGGEVIPCP